MTVHFADDSITLHHGDCLDVLRELPDASVDAVVTDPPYGLGFMGKEWDSLPPGEEWARECLRVLKPGGHLLAFGGSRTWHRLAVAIEVGGFEIRDSIAWLYGSGFPKSLDVSKAIDKRPGFLRHKEFAEEMYGRRLLLGLSLADVQREVVGSQTGAVWNWEHHQFPSAKWWPKLKATLHMDDKWDEVIAEAEREKVGERTTGRGAGKGSTPIVGDSENRDITAPSTDAARSWQGWGTALKPAFEPIVVARKPLAGTVAANVLAHGTGALNIDGCRIETTDDLNGGAYAEVGGRSESASLRAGSGMNVPGKTVGKDFTQPSGRWPANVVLDEHQAAELDEQSGTLTSGYMRPDVDRTTRQGDAYGTFSARTATETYGDTGGASRFFYVAKASSEERPRVDGVAHPTVKPLELMRWLVRLITPPGGVVLEPFAGSGTTVEAAVIEGFRCVAIEREAEYLPLIEARIARRRDPVRAVQLAGDDAGLFGLFEAGA
ncbi:DNA-methyltransferase [Nocardioides sp. LML1-1-1.1]|uniref:DNA-methyltransferase n=1 Tax=Nocardioides sp. LML1-1-1.1 TaxID=3135248 RepID=UPI003431949E